MDEIVSLAVIRLDADGVEIGTLAQPRSPRHARSRPRPQRCTASATRTSPRRRASPRSRPSCSSCSPAPSSSPTTRASTSRCCSTRLPRAGIDYEPPAVACTLDAFRLLEPLAPDHRLESLCEQHEASPSSTPTTRSSDASATAALLRLAPRRGDRPRDRRARPRGASCGCARAATRVRRPRHRSAASSRSDTRPGSHGTASSSSLARAAGTADVDALTREQVQDVYDALDASRMRHPARACSSCLRLGLLARARPDGRSGEAAARGQLARIDLRRRRRHRRRSRTGGASASSRSTRPRSTTRRSATASRRRGSRSVCSRPAPRCACTASRRRTRWTRTGACSATCSASAAVSTSTSSSCASGRLRRTSTTTGADVTPASSCVSASGRGARHLGLWGRCPGTPWDPEPRRLDRTSLGARLGTAEVGDQTTSPSISCSIARVRSACSARSNRWE